MWPRFSLSIYLSICLVIAQVGASHVRNVPKILAPTIRPGPSEGRARYACLATRTIGRLIKTHVLSVHGAPPQPICLRRVGCVRGRRRVDGSPFFPGGPFSPVSVARIQSPRESRDQTLYFR